MKIKQWSISGLTPLSSATLRLLPASGKALAVRNDDKKQTQRVIACLQKKDYALSGFNLTVNYYRQLIISTLLTLLPCKGFHFFNHCPIFYRFSLSLFSDSGGNKVLSLFSFNKNTTFSLIVNFLYRHTF
jgi:hypothetical protein